MMTKLIAVLLTGIAPTIAIAAGNHDGGHAMPGGMQAMHGSAPNNTVGKPGAVGRVSRTVEIVMNDSMRFVPDQINVKAGETIRFFVKNTGKLKHEMAIGSMAEFREHAEMMSKMPNMHHAQANMITLNPGQRGGLVWEFDQTGAVDVACLVPGHMEAGMKASIQVVKE